MERNIYDNYSISHRLEKIEYILLAMCILCIPFQDFGLQGTFLNYFGKNLSNLPLLGLFILIIVKMFFCPIINKDSVIYIKIYIYIICYSLIMILVHCNSIYILTYIYKLCSNMIILFFWCFFYLYIKKYSDKIRVFVISAYIIHIIGWILYDVLKINLGTMLRYTINLSERYTGFTSEASFFSFTTVILGLLSIYYIKKNILKKIIILLTIYLLIVGGSKGTLICIFISSIIFVMIYNRFSLSKKLIVLFIIILISSLGFYYVILDSFIGDLEEYTSFATRVSSIFSSIIIIYNYPFGTGFGVFLPIYKEYLYTSFDILNNIIPYISLSYLELSDWMSSDSGANMTIKSIIFQYLAYFGIPFIFMFFKYVLNIVKNLLYIKEYFLMFIFLFVLTGIMTFANFNYDSILVLGILVGSIEKHNKKDFNKND